MIVIGSARSRELYGNNVSFNPQFDITGSNAAPNRPNISGNAVLPAGQRTRATATSAPQYLRAAAFSVPNSSACATKASAANCGFGNAGPTQFYIPGVNNWDIGIYKAFPLGKNEARELQLQLQTFNTFNHTQFNAVDTNYNPDNTGAVGNPTFGQVNGAASPRIMVLGLKLKF